MPVYATGGWMSYGVDELVEEARQFAAAGFAGYKLKVGHADWRVDVERVRRVAEAVGDDLILMVDANQGFTPERAIAAGTALAELGVSWFEEPVAAEDIEGTARVSAALDLQVVVGESVFTSHGFRPLLERGAADLLMLDVMRCGGTSEFLRVAAMAHAFDVVVSSHAFTELSAPAMAASANAGMVEYIPGWTELLFEDAPAIEDGRLELSDRPGLGFGFSERTIRDFSVETEPVSG